MNKHKVFQPLEEVTRSNARFKHTLADKYKIVPSIPISIANISAYDHAEALLGLPCLPSFLPTYLAQSFRTKVSVPHLCRVVVVLHNTRSINRKKGG